MMNVSFRTLYNDRHHRVNPLITLAFLMAASFKNIDSETLRSLTATETITLVDVRSEEEAIRGIIHGAIHIPLHLLPLRAHELEGENPLIFYCRSGVRSAQACSFMASQGRENLFNLQGGVLSWGAAGFALEPKK
jgi:rhodanese-related sulfurtransferase